MRLRSPLTSACVLAVLLCACATTTVKKTWKSPEARGPVNKIAVLTVDERGLLRQGFENRFVAQLKKAGASAVVTYDQLSLSKIKEDKQAAAEALRSSGAESLLILRLLEVGTSYREVQPGGERYTDVVTGFSGFSSPYMGWYDYYGMSYSVAFMSMSPTYGSMTHNVYLQTALFDLNTEKHLWSGVTQTVLKDNVDRVAEMDPLVATILGAMRKDGMIP
jgi:hypothetical protein